MILDRQFLDKGPSVSLYAALPDQEATTKVVAALLDHGVESRSISVILKSASNVYGEEHDVFVQAELGVTTTTPEDAKAGALKGTGVGLGLGALAAVASLTIPGVGLVIGGGALAVALAGLAGTTAAGALAGAVSGYLVDQGVEPHVVEHLSRTVESGGSIVSVTVPDSEENVRLIHDLFVKHGGSVQIVRPSLVPLTDVT